MYHVYISISLSNIVPVIRTDSAGAYHRYMYLLGGHPINHQTFATDDVSYMHPSHVNTLDLGINVQTSTTFPTNLQKIQPIC